MTIYTIIERLNKLEKIFEHELPVFSFKERIEKIESDINELRKIIGSE